MKIVVARLSRTPKPLTVNMIRNFVKVGLITPGEGNLKITELEKKQKRPSETRRYHYL